MTKKQNSVKKNLKIEQNKSYDIIIYSSALDYYLKNYEELIKELNKLSEGMPRALWFFILPQDLTLLTGEKIEKLVSKLKKYNAPFTIYPLPPCLFSGKYPKIIQNTFFNFELTKFPIFFTESSYIKSVVTKEDKYYIEHNKLSLLPVCLNCKYRKDKMCQGAFQQSGSYICHEKLYSWIMDKIKDKASDTKKMNLLDVGCGVNPVYWKLYDDLLNKGLDLYLLDPDESVIQSIKIEMEKHRHTKQSNIYFLHNTIEDIILEKNKFDIIMLLETYDHLEDVGRAFNNIKKLLQKDGIVIIKHTKAHHNLSFKEGPIFQSHFRNTNLAQLISKLEQYNFVIEEKITDKNTFGITGILKVKNKSF